MNQIIQNFAALGARRLILMGGVSIGAVVAAGIALTYAMAPQTRPIAYDLSPSDSAAMYEILEKSGFDPEVSADGSVISLAENRIGDAKIALAGAGLPASEHVGWEIFDNSGGLGMNSAEQKIQAKRASEGELAKTVERIAGIASARVHIVEHKRDTFSQDRPDASASVILVPKRGTALSRELALSVRQIVTGSVAFMKPENVSIISSTGQVILGPESMDSNAGLASAQAAVENRISRNIENLLSAHVGYSNIRVSVAAEIATEREVITQESYDPDQQVARKNSALAEQSSGRNGGTGNVSVANNMPGVENGDGSGAGREDNKSKTLDETIFEIGSTKSEKVIEPGGLKRLTVAVAINGTIDADGNYNPIPTDQLERLAGLVRSAAGYEEGRGDVVTVESLRFVSDALPESEPDSWLSELLEQNSNTIIRGLISLLAIGLIMIFAVRPALARLRGPDAEATPAENADMALAKTEVAGAGKSGAKADAAESESETHLSDDPEYVSITSFSGSVMRRYIDELAEVVDANREDSLRVLRDWIHQKA